MTINSSSRSVRHRAGCLVLWCAQVKGYGTIHNCPLHPRPDPLPGLQSSGPHRRCYDSVLQDPLVRAANAGLSQHAYVPLEVPFHAFAADLLSCAACRSLVAHHWAVAIADVHLRYQPGTSSSDLQASFLDSTGVNHLRAACESVIPVELLRTAAVMQRQPLQSPHTPSQPASLHPGSASAEVRVRAPSAKQAPRHAAPLDTPGAVAGADSAHGKAQRKPTSSDRSGSSQHRVSGGSGDSQHVVAPSGMSIHASTGIAETCSSGSGEGEEGASMRAPLFIKRVRTVETPAVTKGEIAAAKLACNVRHPGHL